MAIGEDVVDVIVAHDGGGVRPCGGGGDEVGLKEGCGRFR
jgi:hypothetical protein